MATIVIIDDSPAWRSAARQALEAAGHRIVAEAEDGTSGLDAVGVHAPELVTLDIEMPNLNGLFTLAIMREVYPTVRVVMVTGTSGAETRAQCRELGAHGFVAKPYDPGELAQAVTEALLQ